MNAGLPSRRPLILDGATGTELDRAGVDVSLPLWSARAIDVAPDVLASIHAAYAESGADIVTTCSFRTTARTLRHAGFDDAEARAAALTRCAVEIARVAAPEAIIAGGIASLEECYAPDMAPDQDTARAEHAEQIGTMLAAGVDMILFETIGTVREAAGAARAAREGCDRPWMMSFCMRGDGLAGHLLSGEPIADAIAHLDGAAGIGINCVSAPRVADEVAHLHGTVGDGLDVLAYANIGHADATGLWISTDAVDPARYAEYAGIWLAAGATIVGGCCGTTPATIRAVAGMAAGHEL